MTTRRSAYTRIRRRETHSPRSVAAIAVAVALILTFAWLALEILLRLLDRPPLLVSPLQMLQGAVAITSAPVPWIVTGAIIVALVGLLLLLVAVTPGRRARHVMKAARSVTVVDDDVIASALARRASFAAGISPDNARVTISRHGVDVRLIPISGLAIDRATVLETTARELDSYELQPTLRAPQLQVDSRGTVGS